MVQLTDALVASLDEEAAARGTSRSALVRELVTSGLAAARRDVVGEQIAAGYRRIPQATVDEWGDLSVQADAAAGALLRRLDAEEREAGLEAW